MKRAPLISLFLGVVLLFGIVAGVVVFTFEADDNFGQQTTLFQSIVRQNLLFSLVQDAETSQRGYLLTQDESYLKPYQAAVTDLPRRISLAEEVVGDDPGELADFATLKKLIPDKFEEIDRTVDLGRTGAFGAAVGLVRSDHGLAIMESIRATVARMRERHVRLLQVANANIRDASQFLRFGVGAVALGVMLLGAYAFFEKRRQRLALERHSLDIEGHSRALEETNRQLTAEMKSRRAAEDQVRQMQKIEAVGQLTGGLAHDFNNMLAVVVSALGLAQRRITAGDSNIGRFLEAASEATNRAATLTKRLLAFSRQQPLNPEPIDANKMVTDMSEILRRTLGETISLETVLAGGLWRISADVSQLENSIVNLSVNARDAMAEGGRITIETANAHLDDLYAADNDGVQPGQYVMVAVTDTGTGMPADVMTRAFDPFFTTKGVGRGTGLGLSQVYGFVKQSHGHIKIYSEVGQGTTVKLYLPRLVSGEVAGPRPLDRYVLAAPQGAASELILLVEDEERVRTLSADTLHEMGYTVLTAENGKVALELLAENPGVVLLFTDIVMPGMNGRMLAEAAAKIKPGLRVLYTTGFTRNAVVHNGILDPGVNFIPKPFTIEQLAAKVRAVLDAPT